MPTPQSWLARVALCVAVALSSVVAAPAFADTQAQRQGAQAQQKTKRLAATPAASISTRDLQCLSEALYFEARGESVKGQRAVAEVIMNRVDHPAFPKSVCSVVNQRGQFSYKGGSLRMRDRAAANRALRIAEEVLAGAPRSLTNGATYFHTTGVRPSWSKRFTRTTRIGSHIFYRRGGAQRVASN